jgi:hypothetical protein
MLDDKLRQWLITEARYAARSAKDVLSRCRRVERIFNVNLDKAVKTQDGLEKIMNRLQNESGSYLKPKVNRMLSVSIMKTAVKLYHRFLNS